MAVTRYVKGTSYLPQKNILTPTQLLHYVNDLLHSTTNIQHIVDSLYIYSNPGGASLLNHSEGRSPLI